MYKVIFKLGTKGQATRTYEAQGWKRAWEMYTSVPLGVGESASVVLEGERIRHREGKGE